MRIKIAVVVDMQGYWSAIGWGRAGKIADDAPMMEAASAGFTEGDITEFIWVGADIDLPTPKHVEGEVEDDAQHP